MRSSRGNLTATLMVGAQWQLLSYSVEQSATGDTYFAVAEDGNGTRIRSELSREPVHDFGKEKLRAAVAEYRSPLEIPPFLRVVVWKGYNGGSAREADFVIERHTIKSHRGR